MVIVAGSELIEDIRRAPDDVLSMMEPINEVHNVQKGLPKLIRII